MFDTTNQFSNILNDVVYLKMETKVFVSSVLLVCTGTCIALNNLERDLAR